MAFVSSANQTKSSILKFRWLMYFLTFNYLIILGISFKYLNYIELNKDFFVKCYFLISYISHFLFLGYLPLIIFLPFILFRVPLNIVKILAIILIILIDGLLIIDSVVFEIYRFHLNSFVVELIFGGAANQIFNIPLFQYLLFATIIALLITFIIILGRISNRFINSKIFFITKIVVPLTLLFLVSSHLIHAWADAAAYQPITRISRFYPLYFPLRAPELFFNLGIIDESKIERNKFKFESYSAKDLQYPLSPLKFSDVKQKPNIIFIILDSWHYQTMDSIITPHINTLALQSQQFKNHNSGSNGTRGGIFSIFYSIPALYWEDMLSTETGPVFISSLFKNGYEFSIHASSALTSPPFDRTVYRSVPSLKIGSAGISACDRDKNLTKDFIQYLDSVKNEPSPNPFFAFLFYDAPHAIEHPEDFKCKFQPEWPNPKYLSLNNEMDPTPFFNLYKNAVNFDDMLVGQVIDKLNQTGTINNSIIIVTGDHGQEFNDNKKNYWGHNGNFSRAQIGVPFILYVPGMKPAAYNHLTLHYDIVPTVMNIALGCQNKIEDYSCGHNLFSPDTRSCFVAGSRENFAIISENKITTVFPNGNYSVTDGHMNTIDNQKFEPSMVHKLITDINRFYKTGGKSNR